MTKKFGVVYVKAMVIEQLEIGTWNLERNLDEKHLLPASGNNSMEFYSCTWYKYGVDYAYMHTVPVAKSS
jgi:hypothetical protein